MGRVLPTQHDWQIDQVGECRRDALRAITRLGPLASKDYEAGGLLFLGESLGWPQWLADGTGHAPGEAFRDKLSLGEVLTASANLYDQLDPFDVAVRVMRMPLAGLSMTTAIKFQVAPTLAHALEARSKIHSRTSPHLAISFSREADVGGIRIASDYLDGLLLRCSALALLGWYQRLAAAMVPSVNRSARIEARLSGPRQGLFANEVGCPTTFGAREDRLVIARDVLDHPNPRFDPGLWELILAKLADGSSQTADRLSREVLTHVRRHLDQGRVPRLKQIADELGQSERTIVRLLHGEGTSYRLLIDDERRARAVDLLTNRSVELSQISELLGFSDPPSFWRTFRRWFGVTPAQYRRG